MAVPSKPPVRATLDSAATMLDVARNRLLYQINMGSMDDFILFT